MSAPALAGRGRASSFTIGEVLSVLRPEFPDVTISKIRFLEEQGLVEPDRTPSGYRKFSNGDVERLRHVLTLQRDHFLPLRVIREQLDADDGPAVVGRPAAPGPFVRVLQPEADDSSEGAPDAAALARAAGTSEEFVAGLVGHGLLRPRPDGWFGPDDVEVTRAAVSLAEHGLQARHLRGFRSAADKEVDLVEQVVAPLRRAGRSGAAGEVADTAREVAASCLRLHAALVAGSLTRR